MEYRVDSVADTVELGRKLGSMLQKGDNVCLFGDPGSKTAFAGGIAKGLGITVYIAVRLSPSSTSTKDGSLYHLTFTGSACGRMSDTATMSISAATGRPSRMGDIIGHTPPERI